MSSSLLPDWIYHGPGRSRPARGWSAALSRRSSEEVRRLQHIRRIQQRIADMPADMLTHLTVALQRWWKIKPEGLPGLELVVVHPDGTREKHVLFQRILSIGRSPTCAIQLMSTAVSKEHCEIRLDPDRVWVMDLNSTNKTRVHGVALPPFEPVVVKPGDEITIQPYRLVVGDRCATDTVEAVPRFRFRESWWFPTTNPFPRLGTEHTQWIRLRLPSGAVYAGLPLTWLDHAYRALGYPPPARTTAAGVTEVDRAVTGYILAQVLHELSERTGVPLEMSPVLPAEQMVELAPPDARAWDVALFEMQLGRATYEIPVTWPTAPALPHEPHPGQAWLSGLWATVGVHLGHLRLALEELTRIEPGDIVLPDRWYPHTWPPDADAEAGTVLLYWQHRWRTAHLRRQQEVYILEPTDSWVSSSRGIGMPTETQEMGPKDGEREAVRLPEDLEVVLIFELARISVPLKKLMQWEPGSTITLNQKPDDEISIVLQQGNQGKVVGMGKVVLVHDQLGIQIERWLVEPRES